MDDNTMTQEPGVETAQTTPQEIFTKPTRDGSMISYIEREVDRFDFDGYEVVRRELFSKANCPAVTIKYGSVNFNVRAIRKLNECSHIHILINPEKKLMIAKPCGEDEKVVPRTITGKVFTAQLYDDMKWDFSSTIKVLGTLLKCRDEKIFVFDLVNAEAYISVSAPSPDDPKRRQRVPLMPAHWQGNYGQAYEESKVEIVKTFEGVPEGFVKITLPQLPTKKPAADNVESNGNINEKVTDGTV